MAQNPGPSFSDLVNFANLVLFGKGQFTGYSGRDFDSEWPENGRPTRSKLRKIFNHLESLDTTSRDAFIAQFPVGKNGMVPFSNAYESLSRERRGGAGKGNR